MHTNNPAASIKQPANSTHDNDIRPLTGLRGVAALWVVVHHMLLLAPLPTSLNTLVHHGYLAVDIFFMLSGFVMSLTYERMFRTGLLGRGYAIFLLRRLARVYPLYVVTLLAVAALNLAGFSHSWSGGFANFVFNLLMIHGWGFYDSINSPAWSISTEFAAYLLFPAFTLLILRQRWLRIASVTLFIAGIALMSCVSLNQGAQNGPLDIANEATIFPLLRCLCEFGIGMAIYVAAKDPRIAKACSGKRVSAFIVIALFACLLTPQTDVVVVLATPFVIVIAATSRKAPVSRFLGSAPVFFLGEISYAMYLLHSQFLRIYRLGPLILERHHMPHTLALLISIAAVFGSLITASYLAFRYLEVPARNAIRRLESRLQPRVPNAVAVQS